MCPSRCWTVLHLERAQEPPQQPLPRVSLHVAAHLYHHVPYDKPVNGAPRVL